MQKIYSTDEKDFTLYKGDVVDIGKLPYQKFDMIFADPPYFLSKGFSVSIKGCTKSFEKGEWDRVRDIEEVDSFNYAWLSRCREYLKDDGTIWVCGTFHNVFSVASCMQKIGYKILNVIVWQKADPRPTFSDKYFSFTAEFLIWARKEENTGHFFNFELMKRINGGKRMTDIWRIPIISSWELRLGKHPTQKPLKLLYRVILSSTQEQNTILDPFAGSCTTGIAANLLKRNFVGIDLNEEFLKIGIRRRQQIDDPLKAQWILNEISSIPEEEMVLVNHARKETREKMIETGICYIRAGESNGSVLVEEGFERLHYVLLHTNGKERSLYRLKKRGCFQIWKKETLEKYGFKPSHAPYYIVLHFDNTNPIKMKKNPNLNEKTKTFMARLRPLSEFMGLK